MKERWRIRVRGIVQGVGFRPFVFRLATELKLCGCVRNDNDGVLLEVEGDPGFLRDFFVRLKSEAPSASKITSCEQDIIPCTGEYSFVIERSDAHKEANTLISPDLALCKTCKRELFDKKDRRFRYPFINCTACGPRYSIIEGAPYDRERTSMKSFSLCDDCAKEFHDIHDRRFHAQPNACGKCGPKFFFVTSEQTKAILSSLGEFEKAKLISSSSEEVEQSEHKDECEAWADKTREFIARGKIVAIKGIGGYHLACDATNDEAVSHLRKRKGRANKPLAVMAGSLKRAREIIETDDEVEHELTSVVAPIVLAPKKHNSLTKDMAIGKELSPLIAPGNSHLGVMLPYAPQHYLLLREDDVWVMTSANSSGEPQITDDGEAVKKLFDIADAFLIHNREIVNGLDDSLVSFSLGEGQLLRRGRGYAPSPIALKGAERCILAGGAELKSAFCFAAKGQAFLSEHIGDLKLLSVYERYKEKTARYEKLFSLKPEAYAVDLHGDYFSTKFIKERAREENAPCFEVAHHHAHIASVLAEHGEEGEVIGIAFDGAGLGTDGKIWGGEFLRVGIGSFTRLAHFRYLPLPGGDKAAKEPWRIALYVLSLLGGETAIKKRADFANFYEKGGNLLIQATNAGVNAPLTSSAGRLFDAASSLLGLDHLNTWEGEAACALENAAKSFAGKYQPLPYKIFDARDMIEVDMLPALFALADEFDGENTPLLARSFHLTLAKATAQTAKRLLEKTGLKKVALSGGVFQNELFTELLETELKGVEILKNRLVPTNDGGIAYGQAAVAARLLERS